MAFTKKERIKTVMKAKTCRKCKKKFYSLGNHPVCLDCRMKNYSNRFDINATGKLQIKNYIKEVNKK